MAEVVEVFEQAKGENFVLIRAESGDKRGIVLTVWVHPELIKRSDDIQTREVLTSHDLANDFFDE